MRAYLRKALPTDRDRYFRWVNDEEVQRASFKGHTVTKEEHRAWYEKALADPDVDMFVCMDFFLGLGQVRLTKDPSTEGTALISYSVDRDMRGQGVAKRMLSMMEPLAAKKYSLLRAEVKPDNAASIKVFRDLGYREVSRDEEKLVFEKTPAEQCPPPVKRERDGRFELLRLLAMMMIVTLHYLSKGELLVSQKTAPAGDHALFWLLECFCLVSVNAYVLISGYFAPESRFSLRRIVKLWLQLFFYSVVIAAVCLAAGIEDIPGWFNLYGLQFLLLPVSNSHYWFASVYIILSLIAPFMSKGIKSLGQFRHGVAVIVLLVFDCLVKSFDPIPQLLDDKGLGILWFITLYLTGAYIRLYGLPFIKHKLTVFISYVVCSLLVIPWFSLMRMLTDKGFEAAIDLPDDYNSLPVYFAAVALFMCFVLMKERKGGIGALAAKLSPYVFGVYLLHEHVMLRYRWPIWLKVGDSYGYLRPLHILGCVLLIMAAGIFIDFLRTKLFDFGEWFCDWALGIYYAKKEVWDYLIAGVLATIVSWVTYPIFAMYVFSFLPDTWRILIGNAASWLVTVIFAYVTNRSFVFHSEKTGFKDVATEFIQFVAARLFSFGVEEVLMVLLVQIMGINEILVKYVIVSIIVIVLNYILSKLWIFKDKKVEKKNEKA